MGKKLRRIIPEVDVGVKWRPFRFLSGSNRQSESQAVLSKLGRERGGANIKAAEAANDQLEEIAKEWGVRVDELTTSGERWRKNIW